MISADTTEPSERFRHVVLQPTTGCNLNCAYCYLPDRKRPQMMSVEVATAIAEGLRNVPHVVYLLWHGGEPLSCGLDSFRELVKPFAKLRASGQVRHSLQTNGTLITPAWCEFFEQEEFRIGISFDGPEHLNAGRVTWANKSSYSAVRNGIDVLDRHRIKFGIIAVVNTKNIDHAQELYNFFLSIPCKGLNFNIEEREGLNQAADDLDPLKVRRFWKELFDAWRSNPKLPIREFENVLGWMRGICEGQDNATRRLGDLWPTVAFNGDVVVLSPELIGANKADIDQFIVGNVLRTPFLEIVTESRKAKYVEDILVGKEMCKASCPYFSFCGGGQPSNKYFELGRFNVTETAHCRNTRQAVVDAVLTSLAACD